MLSRRRERLREGWEGGSVPFVASPLVLASFHQLSTQAPITLYMEVALRVLIQANSIRHRNKIANQKVDSTQGVTHVGSLFAVS